jgi:carbon monoxide dehydrogenase subunit G
VSASRGRNALRTHHVEESVRIGRPPADVWAAIADYPFDLQWRKGITEMTPDPPGPPALGTRVHEVLKLSGKRFTTDSTVVDVDPGVSYAFAGSGTSGEVRGARRVRAAPDGGGAEFTYAIDLEPRRGLRALGPLLVPMLRSGLRKDLERLKELLEHDGRAA